MLQGDRTPPVPKGFMGPLDDLLDDIGTGHVTVTHFLAAWADLKATNDAKESLGGTAASYRIEGDDVHFLANYDQWDGGDEVSIPLALVDEMIEQYLDWLGARR
ncbi:MAG: hypothetical protein WAM30_13615 [Candidatus Dormiibacterota bacterium]